MTTGRILILESRSRVFRTIGNLLVSQGYEVVNIQTGDEALALLSSERFDLILLDSSRRIELCREIRGRGFKMPVIIATTRDSGEGTQALDAGADDFVVKPLDIPEVLARIQGSLRKAESLSQFKATNLQLGPIQIDFETRRVVGLDRQTRLSPKEFELLSYLAANANRTITYRELLDAVWASKERRESLRVIVERLRKKIECFPERPEFLVTDPWVGYRMRLPT